MIGLFELGLVAARRSECNNVRKIVLESTSYILVRGKAVFVFHLRRVLECYVCKYNETDADKQNF